MAKYAYIKSGFGTSTSPDSAFSSEQAEAFGGANLTAANCYDSIVDAISSGAFIGDGNDHLQCSSLHAKSHSATTTLIFPNGSKTISVDDSDCSQFLAGAKETANGDITLKTVVNGTFHYNGVEFGVIEPSGDDILLNADNITILNENATFTFSDSTSASQLFVGGNGSTLNCKNITISFIDSGQMITAADGSNLIFNGGSIDYNGVVADNLFIGLYGGVVVKVSNMDLSGIGTGGQLVKTLLSTHDTCSYEFTRCKLPASCIVAGTIGSPVQKIDVWSCDTGTGYHYFEHHRYEGVVKESTQVKRTGGATYDGSTLFSAEFLTTDKVEAYTKPLKFNLGDYKLQLSTSKVLTFYVMLQDSTAPDVLNNDECWIDIESPDATDYALGVITSTKPSTITTTPVALTLSSETWSSNQAGVTQMKIEVTVPASFDGAPVTAYLNLAKDITGIGTTEFFACPDPLVT